VGTETRSGDDKGRRVDVRRLSERGRGKRDVEIISSVGEVGGESSRDGSGLVVVVGVELKRAKRRQSQRASTQGDVLKVSLPSTP
jgi:hypothetical protein